MEAFRGEQGLGHEILGFHPQGEFQCASSEGLEEDLHRFPQDSAK
jgi:hypothetical protein